ncbi:MAG: glycoside-pentoside-hexuronide (GPH):cation symporter [Dermatophilaceae bacterium]
MASTATSAAPASSTTAKPLTIRNYLGYAAGDFANNLTFSMAGMFLILYYTNVVGIGAAVVGTMFLVVRFFDAITDLLVGRFVDTRRPGRLGKFRPLILIFALPLLLSSMAIYSAKQFFPDISGTAAVVYMYVTYILMGSVFYTLVNIPYGSMAPSMTQVPTERGKLATFRMYGAMTGLLFLAFLVGPQLRGIANDPDILQQRLFTITASFVVIGAALYAFLIFSTREQVARSPEPVSMKQSFATLRKNKPLLLLSGSAVLYLSGMTALTTLGSYIAIYVQQDAQFIAWNTLAQVGALLVVGPLVPSIVRSVGKKTGYVSLALITVAGAAVLAFAPLSTAPWWGLVAFFIMGLGINGVNTFMWALEADTVEFGEWKTGARTEGTTYAVFSFTRKMGQAVGGFIGGIALTIAGFSAARASGGEAQAAGVGDNIQLWAGGLVALFSILAALVMYFYPLTDVLYKKIVQEIADRRIAKEAASRGF